MSAFSYVRGFIPLVHSGIDLAASTGTPIHAVAGGSVIWAADESAPGAPFYVKGGGNVVVIGVAPGIVHVYAHMDSIRTSRGAAISAGGLVGTVGATGHATGPHLHFAIWVNGKAVNPNNYYTTAAIIAAVSGSAPGGVVLASYPSAGGAPLTFWGVVTFDTGHVLTDADVSAIMDKLNAAGFFKDDIAGVAASGVRSLLTAMVGRQWNDQLALDIQKGLDIGGQAVKGQLPAILPFGSDIAGVLTGLPNAIGAVITHAGQGLILAVLLVLGIWFLLRQPAPAEG